MSASSLLLSLGLATSGVSAEEQVENKDEPAIATVSEEHTTETSVEADSAESHHTYKTENNSEDQTAEALDEVEEESPEEERPLDANKVPEDEEGGSNSQESVGETELEPEVAEESEFEQNIGQDSEKAEDKSEEVFENPPEQDFEKRKEENVEESADVSEVDKIPEDQDDVTETQKPEVGNGLEEKTGETEAQKTSVQKELEEETDGTEASERTEEADETELTEDTEVAAEDVVTENNKTRQIQSSVQEIEIETPAEKDSEPVELSVQAATGAIEELENHPDAETVAYNAEVNNSAGALYNKPEELNDAVRIGGLASYSDDNLVIRREMNDLTYNWALAEHNNNLIGWTLNNYITPDYEEVEAERTVAYDAVVDDVNGRYQIFNIPAYLEGNYQVADSQDYVGDNVVVRGEIETNSGTDRLWTLVESSGCEIGWINSNALIPEYEVIDEQQNTAYNATITTDGRYQIFNRPAYTEGNYQVADSSNYEGEDVVIREEILTSDSNRHWVQLEHNGELVGWINQSAIAPEYETITSNRTVAYEAEIITTGRYQIFNRPAYTEGNYQVANSSNLTGNNVVIRGEIETDYARDRVWTLIEDNGNLIGWINSKALTPIYDEVLSSRSLNHPRIIRNRGGRFQVFNTPAYTEGNYQVADVSDYHGEVAVVTSEIVTERATWQLLTINGVNIGWMNRDGLRKPIVYIDPGHGGYDPGATHGGVQEKDLNLKTSLYLKDRLNETYYYDVVIARGTDRFVSLDGRTDHANRIDADIFVSIHYNSMGGSGAARGIETFLHHRVPSGFGQETRRSRFRTDIPRIRESLELADAIHPILIQRTGLYDRGIKGNNFHVLRETNMPAVLVELGFLDNYTERNHVNTLSYQRRAAYAIADGIDRYFFS